MDPLILIKALCFLAFVLLLAYACFLILRKHLHKKTSLDEKIIVLSRKIIDQKLSVSLLEVDGKKIIIAVAPGAISITKIKNTH